ncbi:MAG: PHB depolymerase family esterase [Mucilaginibacter sp.]|uniref:extracellular catalytic domain type 1 short-chain-length polyhydroxyalkanoate depolymerase n=1 Tax=Mucilaginibacter sp. TaxID=1882438 RepID=UPI0034E524D9
MNQTIIIIVGILLVFGLIAYFYFAYAPAPNKPQLSSKIEQATIQIANQTRSYLFYVPKELSTKPALIIALHGSGMDAAKMRQWTAYEFDQLADQKGFAVIYPNGYKGNWNDCRSGAPFPAKKENIDDVGLIRNLIEKFKKDYEIDPGKVFVFGFSNGGHMALRLAMEQPNLIAAVSAVSANIPTPATCSCTLKGQTSRVMLITGTKDPINPYNGGNVTLFGFKKLGAVVSAQASAENLTERNGITTKPLTEKLYNAKENDLEKNNDIYSERQSWIKSGQTVVELCTINGGGHAIPQPNFRFPRLLGKTSKSFDAPQQAVSFFGI